MASSLFNSTITTRIHDIDAAGVVFYARIFYFAHNAYEDFLNHHQQAIKKILESDIILPIKHTEADFKAPILLNENIAIEISLHTIKENEFTLNYSFSDAWGNARANALTQHICLDANTKKRQKLPDSIRSILLQKNAPNRDNQSGII